MPDAAGLVLASDQDDARAYAEIVEQVTGEAPVVILSDDPKASDKITAFTARDAADGRLRPHGVRGRRHPAGGLPGLDDVLPDAAVLRAGRRPRRPGPGARGSRPPSSCRPCGRCSRSPPSSRRSATTSSRRRRQQDEDLLDVERVEPEPAEREANELVDADASFAHVLHGGRAVVAANDPLSDEDEDFLGLPGILSPEQTAALLARRDSARPPARRRQPPAPASRRPRPSAWRAGAELRREVNRLVGVLAARTGTPHGQIHAELRRAVPGPASAAASAEVLEQRRDHLMERLGGG